MLVFDVSEYNGGMVLPKCDGLIARCTKKTNEVDKTFFGWMNTAKELDINFGAYKYTYAHNVEEARMEAMAVCQLLRGCGLELGFWLDIENDFHRACPDYLIKDIINVYKHAFEHYNIKFAGVYCDLDFYKVHRNALEDCDLWLARWTNDRNKQPVMFDNSNVKGWQYTNSYCGENLDASIFKSPITNETETIKYNPDNVKLLQNYLNKEYGYQLKVDGIMGTKTFTALCQTIAK